MWQVRQHHANDDNYNQLAITKGILGNAMFVFSYSLPSALLMEGNADALSCVAEGKYRVKTNKEFGK